MSTQELDIIVSRNHGFWKAGFSWGLVVSAISMGVGGFLGIILI